jgi:hypothetical protein
LDLGVDGIKFIDNICVANKNLRIMKFNLNKRILFAVPAIMGLTAMQAQTTAEVKSRYQCLLLILKQNHKTIF